jgi:hypothetical protein
VVGCALISSDAGGEVVGVFGGGFDHRVEEPALLTGVTAPGLQLAQLFLEAVRGGDWVDRFDVQADVDAAGVGQQRLQPAGMHLPRITGDRERRDELATDFQMPRCHRQRIRSERARSTQRRRARAAPR